MGLQLARGASVLPARMLDPGLPDVQRFVVDVVLEVVDKYDVDGVHLDYVRYPSRRFGYHPESIGRFVEEHGFDPLVLRARCRGVHRRVRPG